ncbi:MAG TPA: hypothetical protein PLX85_06020, partial [Dehalococcoidia bacterium]|nr:hypothetical protein [Dehalococcoidia bacterium]
MRRLMVVTAVLLVLSGCSAKTPTTGDDDSGNLIPRPKTVEQLTQRTRLIVIGTVLDVQGERSEGPIGGSLPTASGVPSLPTLAFTYYTVRADSIVAGADLKPGERFTLRVNGSSKERT